MTENLGITKCGIMYIENTHREADSSYARDTSTGKRRITGIQLEKERGNGGGEMRGDRQKISSTSGLKLLNHRHCK